MTDTTACGASEAPHARTKADPIAAGARTVPMADRTVPTAGERATILRARFGRARP
ncbi:hypothetical protein [Halovivax sp.]|uniref:hypothetical protein n=1 Tax=Halovivax sp. TaxID=1935978 RepID=UPI0025BFA7C6|nr:hypothetical protein [Halovivax sp.]